MQPYNFTKLDAFDDQDLGALIVRDNGSYVIFSVDVVADPCPNVEWSLNGTRLGPSNETITYNSTCIESYSRSPNWTFSLNVTLTAATSGSYSASFSNVAGTTFLPKTYITIPGMLSCIFTCVYSSYY